MSKKFKRKEIGKGIGALLNNINTQMETNEEEKQEQRSPSTGINTVPLDMIEVNPFQPRKDFDETALQELAESIKIHGLIQPITVRRMNDRSYQLISGERRMRASKLAGLTEVPAYIRTADDQTLLEMALIENIQREDLNAIEVAVSYKRLIDECDLTHEAVADRVGKKRSSVSNYLRLLTLPPAILDELKKGNITMGHARSLRGVDHPVTQVELLHKVLNEELSVRALEKVISDMREPKDNNSVPKSKSLPSEYESIQKELRSYLGAKVDFKLKGKNKGQIVINFGSVADLNRILELIEE